MPLLIREALRRDTAEEHRRLDDALGAFDLSDADAYAAFLAIHARALLPLEQVLRPLAPWGDWRSRGEALTGDLAALGRSAPAPLPVDAPTGSAGGWGMLYVLEGSRLGGTLLARRVAPGLPRAYLDSSHAPGEWRTFLEAMETGVGPEGYPSALTGARTAFALFATAAREPIVA